MNATQESIWRDRYALKDHDGNPIEKDISQTWRRVANAVGRDDHERELFYTAMSGNYFIPGGRIIANAGAKNNTTLFNCYVLPSPEDSRGGIFDSLKLMTEIMARGGGVGIDLSTLRPRGSYIKTVNGTSSGPVSWANLYSVTTGDVVQQGGSRRGALMIALRVDHPDIEEFITYKRDNPGRLEYANLSVAVTNAFMDAVKSDADWSLVWGGETKKIVNARALWRLICESAWASGEPGVIFIDGMNEHNPVNYMETIRVTNPCGEVPLPPYGVCNLGSMNLTAFIDNDKFEWMLFRKFISVAVRFLDNVIDLTPYFIEENEKVQKDTRRIGLGTMGLAHTLFRMKLRYGSKDANLFVSRLFRELRDAAYLASIDLAKERGAFPGYSAKYLDTHHAISHLPSGIWGKIKLYGIRNASLLAQAPTGTTAQLIGVSSGIEPVYDLTTTRNDAIGKRTIIDPVYEEWLNHYKGGPPPEYFVTAKELTAREHVEVQSIIQQFVDSSVSKTVNAPNSITVEEIMELYETAFERGCKGITVFRDGSREGVLSSTEKDTPEVETAPLGLSQAPTTIVLGDGPFDSKKMRVRVPNELGEIEELHINVTLLDGKPVEVFINGGDNNQADYALIGRFASKILKLNGGDPTKVIENGWAVKTATPVFGQGNRPITCVGNAVSYVLGKIMADRKEAFVTDLWRQEIEKHPELKKVMEAAVAEKVMNTLKLPAPLSWMTEPPVKVGDKLVIPMTTPHICPRCKGNSLTPITCDSPCTECGWVKCGD